MHSFSALPFDVRSLTSQIEHQAALITGHGRNACELQSFLLPIGFISVELMFGDMLQISTRDGCGILIVYSL